MPKEKKKIGRPAETPGDTKRRPLNMRTTNAIRDRLEVEIGKSGRSLAQEVEHRLEQSFSDDDATVRFFGDRKTMALMRAVLFAKEMVEGDTGKSMHEDYETNVAAKYAMSTVLTYLRKKPGKSANYVQRERAYGKALNRAEKEYEKRTGKKITDWIAVLAGMHEGFESVPPNPERAAMKRGEALAKTLFARLSEGVGKDPMAEAVTPVDTED